MTDDNTTNTPAPAGSAAEAELARRSAKTKEAAIEERRKFFRQAGDLLAEVGFLGGAAAGGATALKASQPADQKPVLNGDQLNEAALEKLQAYLDAAKPGELKAEAVVKFYQATLKSLRETNDAALEHNNGSGWAMLGGAVGGAAVGVGAALVATGDIPIPIPIPNHDGSKPGHSR